MRRSARALAVLCAAVAALSIQAVSAAAEESAVIGRLNPTTGQATLFTDRLKKTFPDGGPIDEAYLQQRQDGQGWVLVRAGRLNDVAASCWTEVFHVGQQGNDLVLSTQLVPAFSCAEVEDRCKPSGVYPVLCIPTADGTNCACRPPGFAAPAATPKCEKVLEVLTTSIWDIVWH